MATSLGRLRFNAVRACCDKGTCFERAISFVVESPKDDLSAFTGEGAGGGGGLLTMTPGTAAAVSAASANRFACLRCIILSMCSSGAVSSLVSQYSLGRGGRPLFHMESVPETLPYLSVGRMVTMPDAVDGILLTEAASCSVTLNGLRRPNLYDCAYTYHMYNGQYK